MNKKVYIAPSIKIKALDSEMLLAGSGLSETNQEGVNVIEGETNDDAGAKRYNVWDNDNL